MRSRQIVTAKIVVRAVVAVVACAVGWATASAQSTPQIRYLFPPGAQRGTTVDVEMGSEYLPGPGQLSSAGDAVSIAPGTDEDHRRLTIAASAEPGPIDLRLSTVQGASTPFPFVVGELPELVHLDAPQPQPIEALPVTINGRLEADGDWDEFFVTLAAGEQIVCAATTRGILSPIDPQLRLRDADDRVVAESFSHRSADALLVYRATRGGRYRLQIYDFQMNGGPEFVYRVMLTTGPWVDYTFPAGVSNTTPTTLAVHGWNLSKKEGEPLVVQVAPQTGDRFELTLPQASVRPTLPVIDAASAVEIEPNDDAAHAMPSSLPLNINGRLDRPGDVDTFVIQAAKKEKIAVDVESLELGFPVDGVLAIHDESGKQLVEADDSKTSRDPSLRFVAPADGRYFISLRDRVHGGGPDYVYRLRMSSPRPQLSARVNTASLLVPNGQTVNLPVVVERIDGLEGEFEIAATDLPAGITVAPQPLPAKTPATVQLPLTASAEAIPSGGLVQIVIRRKGADSTDRPAGEVFSRAQIAASATATRTSDRVWIAVGPEIPFTVKISNTILDAPRLAAFAFPVTAVRKEGFTGPICLVGVEPDRRGTLKPLVGEIAAGADAGSIPLVLQQQVIEGTTHRCRVMGVAEVRGADGKLYPVFHIAPGNMSLGCQPNWLTLTAAPALASWQPGKTLEIEVRLSRRVAMNPVRLSVEAADDLPGLQCEPVVVPTTDERAILRVKFPEQTISPRRTLLTIVAESSRDGLVIYGKTGIRIEAR